MNKMSKLAIGQSLFAVSDHHVIIEVKVESLKPIQAEGNLAKITTALVDNTVTYNLYQHDAWFQTMYLRDDRIDKPNVFLNISDARSFALSNLADEKARLLNTLAGLEKKEQTLKETLGA
jgi:hypothetical protein